MSDPNREEQLRKQQSLNGIRYVQVNSARQMVEAHTRGRIPQSRPPLFNHASTMVPTAMTLPRSQNDAKIHIAPPVDNIKVPAPSHSNEQCSNPQCLHCGAVIIPSPQSSLPIKEEPSISINNWEIYTTRKPILNAKELDVLELRYDIPLPEMIFGHNKVEIYNPELKWGFGMNTIGAMDLIKTHVENPEELIKVSYANEWYKARQALHANTEESIIDVYKPYDWTYTTNYKGDEFTTNEKHLQRDDEMSIPLTKLTQRVPILFFQEFVLFEDELGDNGISILSVKIRCMQHCMLLLLRFFLRVDNVLFRIYDTRFYVDFEENTVIREFKMQESRYDSVMSHISPTMGDPRSLLRDSNWCSTVLETKTVEREFVNL